MVFESNGKEHAVYFTCRPLGLIFCPKLPLVVEATSNATARLGVQAGWVLKSVDRSNISGMSYDQVLQLLAPLVERKLPVDANLQNGLEIVFESNGEERVVNFTKRPLGVTFNAELPLTVH